MAYSDYICCGECGCKIIYDDYDVGRDRMEDIWGDPDAVEYTVELLCPDCIKHLKSTVE